MMTPDQRKEEAERVLESRTASFRVFLEHPHGEECLKHIEYLGYVHRPTTGLDATGRLDPGLMTFREGRRSLAVEIRNRVAALKDEPVERQERAVGSLERA